MKQITEELIHELYQDVLAQEHNVIKNNCDNIANTIGYELEKRFEIPAYTVKAPVNGKKHFICLVPGEYVCEKPDTEFIVIDGALTQFSETYPSLHIASTETTDFYDTIQYPEYTLPESTEKNQSTL